MNDWIEVLLSGWFGTKIGNTRHLSLSLNHTNGFRRRSNWKDKKKVWKRNKYRSTISAKESIARDWKKSDYKKENYQNLVQRVLLSNPRLKRNWDRNWRESKWKTLEINILNSYWKATENLQQPKNSRWLISLKRLEEKWEVSMR